MKYILYLTRITALAVTTGLVLMGCGGGGGGTSVVTPVTAQGQLVDAPVEGVSYQSGAQTGVTGRDGEFTYEVGKPVRFFLGRIELGEVPGKSLVTPLDLASDGATTTDGVINIARFLQSLDADVNDERITIPVAVRSLADQAASMDFKNPYTFAAHAPQILKQLTAGVKQYNVVVNLVDTTTAALHLKASLQGFGIKVDVPGQKPTANPAALSRFTSAEALGTYIKDGLRRAVATSGYWKNFVGTTPGPADTGSATATAGASAERFSTTNIQETGVDEADIVKFDGRYLYVVNNPPAGNSTVPNPTIRILEVFSQPPASVQQGEISLADFGCPIDGLYLLNGRGSGKPDLLAVVGGRPPGMWNLWINPWFWQGGKTKIALYNVDKPATPAKITRISIDGQFIASRRIGEVLYVVTRYTPSLQNFRIHPLTAQESQQNEALLEQAKLADLLPQLTVNGSPTGSLVRADVCFLPPRENGQPEQADLISVTAVNLNMPEAPITQTIVGAAETVYVSPQSLYLATTRNQYRGPGVLWADIAVLNASIPEIPPEITDIHQFDLTPDGPLYQGSGSVFGHLGGEMDKRPFRFSEQAGVLRVATSLGNSWNSTSRSRLSLLRRTAGNNGIALEEISFIDHIGKPGEQLYAVRYVGDRAYLVTFRVTDPLYVFDLSNPEKPVKRGELQIDGYSDYLHPIGGNLLLGMGKAAVPDQSSSDFSGRGAWYQGVKLSLFDVSDPAVPREVSSLILGKRGTQSPALADHHALSYLPPVNLGPARLAIPVQLHDTVPNDPFFDPAKPGAYYDWTRTSLYLFEIDTGAAPGQAAGIRTIGQMVVNRRSPSQTFDAEGGYPDRSVLLGESVHYLHGGGVWSAPWDNPDSLSGPE